MVWKDIHGQEGRYQVSDEGQVKSLSRVVHFGRCSTKVIPERILKPLPDRYGYFKVDFGKDGAK